jgi:prepilin signal peptidase PulO-like enzyme (type II secretory pathway)
MSWGTLYLILFTLLDISIPNYINSNYPLTLLFILLFLLGFSSNIDARCRLIPDIITFPMLMTSFLIASYTQNNGIFTTLNISTLDSIYSAIGAYILCFALALIFYFKNPYSFGGGDVKLISAISAFIGFANLSWILIFSFIIALFMLILKKERYVALAPLVFISFIIWIFFKILYYI